MGSTPPLPILRFCAPDYDFLRFRLTRGSDHRLTRLLLRQCGQLWARWVRTNPRKIWKVGDVLEILRMTA